MSMGSCHTAVKLSSDGFQEHKKNEAVAVAFFSLGAVWLCFQQQVAMSELGVSRLKFQLEGIRMVNSV